MKNALDKIDGTLKIFKNQQSSTKTNQGGKRLNANYQYTIEKEVISKDLEAI